MTSPLILPALYHVPSPNWSLRGASQVRLIVVHDCEGSYRGSIDWFANPASKVSAHYVLRENGLEATQMVDLVHKAWHAKDFNGISIGLELAGFAAKGFNAVEWQAAANIVAYLLHKYKLPAEWTKDGGGLGFCSHYNLGERGGGHKDPTTDKEVWEAFVARVEAAYSQEPPASWVTGALQLPKPADYVPTTDIRHGLQPGTVEWAQAELNARGATPRLLVDNVLGEKTTGALLAFQKANALESTGQLTPETINVLTRSGN